MAEQAEASDRLATIEKLQTSVCELKDACVTLESRNGELETEVERLKSCLSFIDETVKSKREEINQLTAELQQVNNRLCGRHTLCLYKWFSLTLSDLELRIISHNVTAFQASCVKFTEARTML